MADIGSRDGRSPSKDNHASTPPTTVIIDIAIRVALLGLLAYWSLLLISPFLTVVIWSVVLAVALFPVFKWLTARLAGHGRLAALLITALALVIILGPVTALALELVESVRVLSERLLAGDLSIPAPYERIKAWPLVGEQAFELWNLASTNLKAALIKIAPQLKPLGGSLLSVAAATSIGMLKFIASVVIAGFLFVPGPLLVGSVKAMAKHVDTQRGETFVELAGVTIRNVARGVIGVAFLQALLAGIAMMIIKVPAAGIITFIALILGIVQIGPTVIFIPVIVWSWFVMDTMTALLFTAYMVPVGLLDNVLRPIVFAHGMTIPMLVMLVGTIGGTLAHGIIGLFVGPIVLAVAWELLVAWMKDERPSPTLEH